jgi:alkyl hydroperoxide reductase subunit AhpC
VFLIGPDKVIKAVISYPMSTGSNFDEVLRLLDSLQLTAKHKVATPVDLETISRKHLAAARQRESCRKRASCSSWC